MDRQDCLSSTAAQRTVRERRPHVRERRWSYRFRVHRLRPWMLVSAAWIGPAILGGIDVVAQHYLWGEGPVNVRRVLFVSLDWLLYALLTPFVFLLARRWPLARPHLATRIPLQLLFSLFFCAAWAGAGTLLRAAIDPEGMYGGPAKHFASWIFITLPFGVAVYLAMVGIEHATRWFAEARERELQVARLSEQLTGARLAALQAQLNPHFLFNSLNTIAVLVRGGDSSAAARVVEQLSDVLRRTLRRDQASEVTLAEELELVRQYLAVEQARFSDRLRPSLEIDETTLSAAVPAFALQHLVENAIRHGIARRTDAGRVVVTSRRDGGMLELTVEDDGPGIAEDAVQAKGHGLQNTRERLRTLYGEGGTLTVARTAQGTMATLRVPYRVLDGER
jgi:two-component system, LytTR family, sensor kinase